MMRLVLAEGTRLHKEWHAKGITVYDIEHMVLRDELGPCPLHDLRTATTTKFHLYERVSLLKPPKKFLVVSYVPRSVVDDLSLSLRTFDEALFSL